ncbi:hypothetical protein FEM48_Zijuj11G0072100 [Ziziphus jujuba var. spinosa]|uniref:C-JID domain-containing protein n=1 Tax=Ziziphus jujuba var. spinosa TaxID=714518 RepID=A0A978UHK1_ZIZJJ|nr:hypothetical protein FEM48_Zijuj11G0072100 [Ziziphus jujuba var. spinosa]
MNLFDEKPWVGFCLYVLLTWPDNFSDSKSPLHLDFEWRVHGDDDNETHAIVATIPIKHKLILLNMPRVYVKAMLNQLRVVSAAFRMFIPDVEVEMCGIRLVNEQDVGNVIEMITDITLSSHHFMYDEIGALEEYSSRQSNLVSQKDSLKKVLLQTRNIYNFPFKSMEEVGRPFSESSYQVIPESSRKDSSPSFINLQIVAENALKVNDPVKWHKRIEESLEQLVEFDVVITLILEGHFISLLTPFNRFSNYNLCFLQKGILDWFDGYQVGRQRIKVEIPPDINNDRSWRGIAVYVSFSVHEHPTSILDHRTNQLAEIATYCGFESENPSFAANTESIYPRKSGPDFARSMIYDSCFPPAEILDWFGHHDSGSSVTIQLPPNIYSDSSWTGLALCAYFSDFQHQEIHHNLTCQMKTEKVGVKFLHEYEITNEELKKLDGGQFMWLSYIPCLWFSDRLKHSCLIEASFACERQEISAYKCGLRLLYQHDEDEFRQTISHRMAILADSISDNLRPSTRKTGRTKQPEAEDKGKGIQE